MSGLRALRRKCVCVSASPIEQQVVEAFVVKVFVRKDAAGHRSRLLAGSGGGGFLDRFE